MGYLSNGGYWTQGKVEVPQLPPDWERQKWLQGIEEGPSSPAERVYQLTEASDIQQLWDRMRNTDPWSMERLAGIGNFANLATGEIAAPLIKGMLAPLFGAMTAYHGSPYRGIKKFANEAIGSGEGAQAFGWGHYFAENKGTGEAYRKALSPGRGNDIADIMARIEDAAGGDTSKAAQIAWDRSRMSHLDDVGRKKFEDMARMFESGKTFKGQLYEVDIPEKSVMLDWDKPLSAQPDAVKEKLWPMYKEQFINEETARASFNSKSGKSFYQRLAEDLGSQQKASEMLNSMGIDGIQYLDQGSRSGGGGTSNFVVFDPGKINILKEHY